MTAMNDNPLLESRAPTKSPLAAFYGRSEGGLDLDVRLSVEGRWPLGLTLLDPRTGERVTV